MKQIAAISLIIALSFGVGVSTVCAETYFSGNMGVVSASDSNIEVGVDSGELSFDNGFAATGALGQTLGNSGRVEVELGYRTNAVDEITLDGTGTIANNGDLKTFSLMGNAFYDFTTGSSFTPFVGVGLGLANIEADFDLADNQDDTVFAYQLAAGGSLAVTDNLTIDLQYRYFGTDNPDFDGLEAEYKTHNLMFGLRFTF